MKTQVKYIKKLFILNYPINTHNKKLKNRGTHKRGMKRYDGILLSKKHLPHFTTIETTEPYLIFISYHYGIYVEISKKNYERENNNITTPNHIK